MAKLEELERFWNLDDVLRASAVLQMKSAMIEAGRKKHEDST